MVYRHTAAMLILVTLVFLLAACWDKTDLNELALVSMIGVDIDPDTGQKNVYFQIINPLSGTSAKGTPGGEQAPVYTYRVAGSDFGEISTEIYKLLPRKLFLSHVRLLLISKRTALEGILDIVNFLEMLPSSRSSIPMLIVEGQISDVMYTYTPLERLPSDSIDYRLVLLNRDALLAGSNIKINDFVEQMERGNMTVLPMITEMTEAPYSDSGKRSAEIDADRKNFIIEGGAVFRDYRMVGTLNDEQLTWYHLMNGDKGRHVQHFMMNGKKVSVELRLERMRKKVVQQADAPVVWFGLDLELSTTMSNDFVPRTRNEVDQMEERLGQIIVDELISFYESTREKGWDLFRIKDLLRKKAPRLSDPDEAAKNAKVTIDVESRLRRTGSIKQTYEGTR